jgi:hypothetical protein
MNITPKISVAFAAALVCLLSKTSLAQVAPPASSSFKVLQEFITRSILTAFNRAERSSFI